MKKLLHERLRDIGQGNYTHSVELDSGIIMLNPSEAAKLSNEIEKYYIPRPRFEDGEPVQFGEEFADCSGNPHTLHEIRYRDKAAAGLGAKCLLEANTTSPKDYDGISFNLYDGTFVKRPEPKVLDADGVEIKAGQTRWHIPTGKKVTIQDLGINKKTAGDSVGLLGGSWVSPLSLSLKEPDSLEKLQQFAVDSAAYAEGSEQDKFLEIADRLTAIMERDA